MPPISILTLHNNLKNLNSKTHPSTSSDDSCQAEFIEASNQINGKAKK